MATTLTPDQLEQLENIRGIFASAQEKFQASVSDAVKEDVRGAWLAFRDGFNFKDLSEADAAALGALLPIIPFLQEDPESAYDVVILMILSLLDNLEA